MALSNQELEISRTARDRFQPRLKPEDGTLVRSQVGPTISYYWTTKVFIKREPHPEELGLDINGNQAINPYIADRLRNEAAVLQFISTNTTIPVPKMLDLWTEHGLIYLKTALVPGVELGSIDEVHLPAAVKHVGTQLESNIIPQLQRLQRKHMGSPDQSLPVIPPLRLWAWKESRVWPATLKDHPNYVFCHTDLDRQNILVHPITFHIQGIIDWETAGYFPPEWELPYWKAESRAEKSKMSSKVKKSELGLFQFPTTNNLEIMSR